MRLDAIRLGDLRRAIEIYLEIAFPGGGGPRVELAGQDAAPVSEVLPQLVDESRAEPDRAFRRYVMRLGNQRYPFMKCVLQEQLIRGEFFLSVDAHDEMFTGASESERRDMEDLRAFNRTLKDAIEGAWLERGLPTQRELRGLIKSLPIEPEAPKGCRILVVDDDRDIGDTIELLLTAKGYEVDRARDGQEALRMIDPQRHRLVVMDNEMPQLCGLAACDQLKSRPETRGIPVLLATAGAIDMTQIRRADAFLAKPFQSEILFSFIERLLGQRQP